MYKNMSGLISRLKRDTGLAFISLPFDNLDDEIRDLIVDTTVSEFSIYHPLRTQLFLDLADLECLENNYTKSTYVLPKINGRDILFVDDLDEDNRVIGGSYYDPTGDLSIGALGDLMLTQAYANVLSTVSPKRHFQFEEPNLLHVYNSSYSGEKIKLNVAYCHADNLSTITKTSWSSFYKLALLDFKMFLYQSLKHFDNIQTAHGTINLRIDEWSNAESERASLLERWDDTYHLEGEPVYVI